MRDIEREAIMHMLDCRSRGMTAAQVCRSALQPVPENPGWDDAVIALVRGWMGLHEAGEPRIRRVA